MKLIYLMASALVTASSPSLAEVVLTATSVEANRAASQCQSYRANSVIRIKIPKGFDISAENRNVKFRFAGDPGADANPNTSAATGISKDEDREFSNLPNVPEPTDTFFKNPFHFSIAEFFPNGAPDLVKVIVFIDDVKYKFGKIKVSESDSNPSSKIYAHGVLATENGKEIICQKIDAAGNGGITMNRGKSVLIFYVRTKVRKGETADLSFIIVSNDTYTDPDWGAGTPILIDPKIKNDG